MPHDLQIALRSLRRTPAFSLIIVSTLAVGIGATAAVLALVNAVLLDALPYREPARLAIVRGEMQRQGIQAFPISYLDTRELAKERSLFADVAAVTGARPYNLTAGAEVEHVNGEMADATYLKTLGVSTALGRWYSADEAAPPGVKVVVLGYDLWQRRFGGKNEVIGSTLLLNEQPYQVIGIAASGFNGVSDAAQLWLPIGLSGGIYGSHYTENREFRWLSAVVRLAPDLTPKRYADGLGRLGTRLESGFPKENGKFAFRSESMSDAYVGGLRKPLYALFAGAALVLLIAVANIANLMLVRGVGRGRETAMRTALGANRWQLVRPVVSEMLVVGVFGAIGGLAIAVAGSRFIVASGAIGLQSFVNVRIDPFVISVAAILSVGSAIVFGGLPAFRAASPGPSVGFGDGGRWATGGPTRRRFQNTLIAIEVAVAVVLLTGAGLVSRGFGKFLRTDLGFKADDVLSMRVDLIADRYKDNAQYFTMVRSLIDQVGSVPRVSRVAIEGPSLPTGGWFQIQVTPDGVANPTPMAIRRHHVNPGYFDALGIKRLEGRDFDATDAPGGTGRSVIVSRGLARRAFPGESAVGKRLLSEGAQPIPLTVVGVVDDVEHAGLQPGATSQSDIYLSVLQSPARSPAVLTLFARVDGPAAPIVESVKERLKTIDRNLSFYDVRTMSERIDQQTGTGRFLMVLMTVFGSIGLFLAGSGVYGVISYDVSQRTREIGVRIALGAASGTVVRGIVRDAMIPVALGATAGLAGVAPLYRSAASLLYGMSAFDLPTIVVALGLIGLAALTASALPAVRASRIDPAVALRAD